MGWTMLKERAQGADASEYDRAAKMAMEGLEMAKEGFGMMCELADQMKEQYGERRGSMMNSRSSMMSSRESYGSRGSYGERDDMDFGERRSRDSRGRYM